MFERPPQTYDINPHMIEDILRDEPNPLNRICALIPAGSTLLDIGAGNGLLARLLKQSGKQVIIHGLEPNRHAAEIAGPYYRHFYTGYAQDYFQQIAEKDYDFIVLSDVVEHMADPLTFLRSLSSMINDRTRLVLSVPNAAFGAVRLALLNGRFDYVDSGLLERTHLRFITLATLGRLITEAGLNPEKLFLLCRDILSSEIDVRRTRMNMLCLRSITRDELAWTYQFLLVLTKERVTTEQQTFGKKPLSTILRHVVRQIFFPLSKE